MRAAGQERQFRLASLQRHHEVGPGIALRRQAELARLLLDNLECQRLALAIRLARYAHGITCRRSPALQEIFGETPNECPRQARRAGIRRASGRDSWCHAVLT